MHGRTIVPVYLYRCAEHQCAINCLRKLNIAKRLFKNYCGVAKASDGRHVAANENMRYESIPEYLSDGGYAAALPQARIGYDQVGSKAFGRGHALSLAGRNRANIVPHSFENFLKKHGDNRLVFHDEDTQPAHWVSENTDSRIAAARTLRRRKRRGGNLWPV